MTKWGEIIRIADPTIRRLARSFNYHEKQLRIAEMTARKCSDPERKKFFEKRARHHKSNAESKLRKIRNLAPAREIER